MTTFTLINKDVNEAITFACDNDRTFAPFMEIEDLMYVNWEMTPCDITSVWARKVSQKPVRWTYHGTEFMTMTYDRATRTFTVQEVVA